MKRIQKEDCDNLGNLSFLNWDDLKNKVFLITGATGLIGSNLVNALAHNSIQKHLNLSLVLLVRNVQLASEMFDWTGAKILPYSLGQKVEVCEKVDYVVHLASPTSSTFFSERPINTIDENYEGIKALLNWVVEHPVKKFVCLSTMEVYGSPEKGHTVTESEIGSFETMNARNSYPIAKIVCESLAYGFFTQYGVPVAILRATQTFGPGVRYDDNRVFAQFMRSVVEKRDIVLRSEGLTERPYLYTADAVSAILLCLIKGTPGEAYTVANPETYISIRDMAKMVAEDLAQGEIKVVFDIAESIEKLGYAQTLYLELDTSKIQSMGWKPMTSLREAYQRMISYCME